MLYRKYLVTKTTIIFSMSVGFITRVIDNT